MPAMVTFARRNLEAEHWADPGFYCTVILFDDIVQVF